MEQMKLFLVGEEVFCKTNVSMRGNLRATFKRLNGEAWCVFESNAILYMCPESNLNTCKGVAAFGAGKSLVDRRVGKYDDQT